jgi:hypothetical protein
MVVASAVARPVLLLPVGGPLLRLPRAKDGATVAMT